MDIDQHIRALGIAHVIYSCLLLIPAAIVFAVLTTVGVFVDDPEAAQILPVVGTGVAIFLFALAIPGLLAGYGVLTKRSWGLPVALVIGLLNILCFPFGTALGGYSLWVFTKANERRETPHIGEQAREASTYTS
jgi:hypothetical protein